MVQTKWSWSSLLVTFFVPIPADLLLVVIEVLLLVVLREGGKLMPKRRGEISRITMLTWT